MIRAAREDDLDEVLALERAVKTAPHWPREAYARCLGEGRCLYVAGDAGAVVGFAAGGVTLDEGELESVAVAVQARGRGIGRALCAAVVGWCVEAGAQTVRLEVRASSVGVIRLYEGLRFVVVGRRPGYYRQPVEDAVLMVMEKAKANSS